MTHLACVAVAARQPASDWTRCVNESGVVTLDDQIVACTAVLQSARDTPANLAIAHQYRLNAYRKKREKTGRRGRYRRQARHGPRRTGAVAPDDVPPGISGAPARVEITAAERGKGRNLEG
jgi:hypothetical protein